MRKVSIIIPFVRPEKALRCATEAEACAENHDGEILIERDEDGIGCPCMVAKLTARAKNDLVMFLGDDTIPQPGFLDAALAAMETLPDGWGLVALNDGIHNGALATHWLADKRLLPFLGGEFFHTGYHHCFCDRELTDIAKSLGRYAYAEKSVIIHDHPHKTKAPYDEYYKRVYAMETFKADQRLYWRRKIERNGFKLAIGLPLVDTEVPAQFAISLLAMDKPDEWTLLVPRFPAGKFHESIASVRNDIVEQALEYGCSHLLMADTDQVYPANTFTQLFNHGKRIVGAAVHRRWPPFTRVMQRGELGRYTQVPENEMYSGDLVKVDATGTGCVLFDTTVFLDLEQPWFEFSMLDGKPVGEDIGFCSKARKAEIEIFVDTSLEVDHLTTFRVNSSFSMLYNKLNLGRFDATSENS